MEVSVDDATSSSQLLQSNPPIINPSKTLRSTSPTIFLSLTFLLFLTIQAASASFVTSSNFLPYYSNHCNQIVPESPITGTHLSSDSDEDGILRFDIGYFTGGRQILPKTPAGDSTAVSVSFLPKRNSFLQTRDPRVVNLQATLKFSFPFRINRTWNRNLREIRFRGPRIPVQERSLRFELYGFWSMSSGKLCMVGSGSSYANSGAVSSLSAVLKLHYPVDFSNISSLITGVLESLDDKGNFGYFDSISVLGIPHFGEYKYTLIDKGDVNICLTGNDVGSGGENENLNVNLLDSSICLTQLYRYARNLELEYGSDCNDKNGGKCNPIGGGHEILPKFMTVEGIRCDHGHALRFLMGFSNSGNGVLGSFGYERVFYPDRMLIGEGAWDDKKNRFCMVACRVLNYNESVAKASVGDCSTRLSLRFPRTLTIRHRSAVEGKIWSNRSVNDASYFNMIAFRGSGNMVRGEVQGLKYEYTVLDRVSMSCATKRTVKVKGKIYPNGYSLDMRFDMSVKNGSGQRSHGYAFPLFIGDQLYKTYGVNNNHSGLLNVSYELTFTSTSNFKLDGNSDESVRISAEGTYDKETGVLCMIGCRNLIPHSETSRNSDSFDCQILVSAQFSPLNARGSANIRGTIKSMRVKTDPLYFGQLEISSYSLYTNQAAESIWRMDMEMTMVLISNTLACVFVVMQLYYMNKHPDLPPFISIVMLLVLTLGHMIPLLLNFEALFMASNNRQNIFLGSGGWLEVNEVIVRLVTMIAFLLHFRLLQLTWSTRKHDGSHKSLWLSEKKVICLSLPLYIGGALVAWYVHQIKWKNSHQPYLKPLHTRGYQQHYPWEDLKSYAGLVLDGFLLPQIMFNIFLNVREKALASPFYVGTTIVRLLPHAYDLYRAHSSTWYLDLSYMYANHRQDFYSTAWDIIIPVSGLLFAALLYLQQRYGGRCILPKRFRDSEYEKVPMVNGEELQEEASY